MISQSAWRRRHVAPTAKEAGLVQDGKVFRLFGEGGDCALLEFHPHRIDLRMEVFFARVSMIPRPERVWGYRQHWDQAKDLAPLAAEAMLHWDLIPPPPVALEPDADMPARGYWTYGPGVDPDVCAEALVGMLREQTFPEMRRLLDRDALLAEMRDPSRDSHRWRPPGWAAVLLNSDRVAPDELEPLLDEVERDYPVADEFIAWARAQAAGGSPTR
ncbi:hypothetical protein [Streptomyces stackebrandtii]|uniref:hypothetical protein n=1 Tax=Streptomyces stackebrandtii TaxID=3051177 RepID=UPI0028DB1FF4|nr:hypothetical protein [Streptomyces sp. DSM 40976]